VKAWGEKKGRRKSPKKNREPGWEEQEVGREELGTIQYHGDRTRKR
jgi:hypothetical protein